MNNSNSIRNRQRRHRRYPYGMHRLSIFTVAFCLSLISSLPCMDAKMLLVPKNQVRQGQGQGQASNTKNNSKNLKNNINANNNSNNNRNRKRNTRTNHNTSSSTTSTSNTNNHKSNTKQTNKNSKNNNNNNKNKKGTMKQILLKPKPKKMSEASTENLKLEATIHTNENGEKVLKLTSESSQMVDNAMQSQSQSQNQNSAQLQMKEIQFEQEQEQMEMEEEEPEILFYDPAELKTSPGEPPPLPKNVRDAAGNLVDMAGKHAILIPPHDHDHDHEDAEDDSVQNESNGGDSNTGSTTSNNNSSSSTKTEEASYVQTPQTQDQMIIISTVATMALFVGALSARRLRSRQFLSFCIENESLEDELAYDVAYTTQSTVGASSFYTGAGYDTFGGGKYGGDLRWRGDLEKFDV
jgi:hypothetical protein